MKVRPRNSGCKSWVVFVEDYPVGEDTPGVAEQKHRATVDGIKEALSAARSAV